MDTIKFVRELFMYIMRLFRNFSTRNVNFYILYIYSILKRTCFNNNFIHHVISKFFYETCKFERLSMIIIFRILLSINKEQFVSVTIIKNIVPKNRIKIF